MSGANWTEEQLQGRDMSIFESSVLPQPATALAPVKSPKLRINKTEARYAQYLDLMQRAGEIVSWEFQSWTCKLADDCRYTPDFLVRRADGSETFVDVKGSKKKRSDGSMTYWCEEDAKIKIRVAAAKWPWKRWVICHPLPNGEWNEVSF